MKNEILKGEFSDYQEITNEIESLLINPISIKKIIIYYDEDDE